MKMRNFVNKLKHTKFDFTGSFWKSLIISGLVIAIGFALLLTIGFNKSTELKKGTVLSVVAENEINLNNSNDYNNFKKRVDDVLSDNNLCAYSYQKISIEDVGQGLVIKIDTSGLTNTKRNEVNEKVLNDVKTQMYSSSTVDSRTIEQYVTCETYQANFFGNVLLKTMLCSLVVLILISVYLMFRVNFATGITTLISVVFAEMLSTATIALLRIPLTLNTYVFMPFVVILTSLVCYFMYTKTNDVLNDSENNRKINSKALANIIAQKTFFNILLTGIFVSICLLIVGNIFSGVACYVSFAMFIASICSIFSGILISPYLWALSYFNKTKKAKKEEKQEDNININILKQDFNEDIVRN